MRLSRALALALLFAAACKGPTNVPEGAAATASAAVSAAASAPASATASATASAAATATATAAASASASLSARSLRALDAAVLGAVERGEVPGAVLLVIRAREVVLRKAYGQRSKVPSSAPMTVDTVFDLASLTKPVATATSILLLAERRALRLSDPARKWLPELDGEGRESITIEELLLHTSGLPAGDAISNYADGPERAFAKIERTKLLHPPGETHVYSDLGYLLLGEIVRRVSGLPLDEFAQKNVFAPLGMTDTAFRPGPRLAARAAPTEPFEGKMRAGEVHDPRAHALGGVAGHAGLFSTADDLARYVLLLLGKGELEGKRLLAAETARQMTELSPLPGAGEQEKRALALGPLFGAVGHTGFTGTAFWLDMRRGDAVVLLASRLHPDGKGDVKRLRRDVANAAALLEMEKPVEPAAVRVGIDVLEENHFDVIAGKRVAVVTNHTGKNARGERTIDVLQRAKGVSLAAIFTPEHGLTGDADALVASGKDARTGLPIHSLYGQDKRPTDAQLAGIDAVVFDLQDAGTRFYTYMSTLGYMLEACAKLHVRLVVLDRPNPLGGAVMEGPLLDPGRESFVGYHSLPIRHGLTMGELARLFDAEKKLGADLVVVPVSGLRRGARFASTGLPWPVPSPNLKNPTAALLYPGIGLLELTNLSVGRGTDRPFEHIGAPFLDGAKLAAALTQAGLRGARFSPDRFTPKSSTFAGEVCQGVSIEVTDADRIEPVRLGLTIATLLRSLSPDAWKPGGLKTLLGNARDFEALVRGESAAAILAQDAPDLAAFAERRRPFLLYPEGETEDR